jgi:hypothetical protein
MAEADRYMFDHKELAEALIVKQGIREGLWGISVEFGLAAINVPTGPDKTFTPAAVNLIQKIGIQRFPEANNLTVDAAEVHQQSAVKKPAGKKTAAKKSASRKK